MRVVVTGASGFIGQVLTRSLRDSGVDAVAVTRRPLAGAVQVRDYRDTPSGDVLVHLAETSDRGVARERGASYEDACVEAMNALMSRGYRRLVYASSAILYGDTARLPHDVSDPLHLADPYARAKSRVERLALAHPQAVAARISNVYGAGMDSANVMSTILRQIPGTGPVRVADTAPVRDFVWVDDVASALVCMAVGSASGVFNVGSGTGTSIGDVARAALQAAGEAGRPVEALAPSGRASQLVVDITATVEAFRWRPACSLAEGMARLVAARQVKA